MGQNNQPPTIGLESTVRVSIVVRDERGFTHYYEDVVTTPDAVRDAFNLMVQRAPTQSRPVAATPPGKRSRS